MQRVLLLPFIHTQREKRASYVSEMNKKKTEEEHVIPLFIVLYTGIYTTWPFTVHSPTRGFFWL